MQLLLAFFIANPVSATVPSSPSEVTVNGQRLEVKHSYNNGTSDVLKTKENYVIKGVCWSVSQRWPTETYPAGAPFENDARWRMREQAAHDFPRIKEAGFNTIRLYGDLGLADDSSLYYSFSDVDPVDGKDDTQGWEEWLSGMPKVGNLDSTKTTGQITDDAKAILDLAYENGLKVIVPVSLNADLDVAKAIVKAYKDHPAVLMWMIGNEFNYPDEGDYMWRWPYFYNNSAAMDSACEATQVVAAWIKTEDTKHPIAACLGEPVVGHYTDHDGNIQPGSLVNGIPLFSYASYKAGVDHLTSVDLFGLNIYRGISFKNLFQEWTSTNPFAGIGNTKPFFISEYGVDTWRYAEDSVTGLHDESIELKDLHSQKYGIGFQWDEIELNLSSRDDDSLNAVTGAVALGGCLFEWVDEHWKLSEGSPLILDSDPGYPINLGLEPNPDLYPDGSMHEEHWGLNTQDYRSQTPVQFYSDFGLIGEQGASGSSSWDIFTWDLSDDPTDSNFIGAQADYITSAENFDEPAGETQYGAGVRATFSEYPEYHYTGGTGAGNDIPEGHRAMHVEVNSDTVGGGWGIFRTEEPVNLLAYATGNIKFWIKINENGSALGSNEDKVFFKFEDENGPFEGAFVWLNGDHDRDSTTDTDYCSEFIATSTDWQEITIPVSALTDGHAFTYDYYNPGTQQIEVKSGTADLDLGAMNMIFSISVEAADYLNNPIEFWIDDIRWELGQPVIDPTTKEPIPEAYNRAANPALADYREIYNPLAYQKSAFTVGVRSYTGGAIRETVDYGIGIDVGGPTTQITKNGSTIFAENFENPFSGGVIAVALDPETGAVHSWSPFNSAISLDAWLDTLTGSNDNMVIALAASDVIASPSGASSPHFLRYSWMLPYIGSDKYDEVDDNEAWGYIVHFKDGRVVDSKETTTPATDGNEFLELTMSLDRDSDDTLDVEDTDLDNDGLSNADEKLYGTNILDADTDDDGTDDHDEVSNASDANNTNPRNPDSTSVSSGTAARLTVYPAELNYAIQESSRYLCIQNEGGRNLNYKVTVSYTDDTGWLSVKYRDHSNNGDYTAVTLNSSLYYDVGDFLLKVDIDRSLMDLTTPPTDNTYDATITIDAGTAGSKTINVSVPESSLVKVNPTNLVFRDPQSTAKLYIENPGLGELSWSVTSPASWLSFSSSSGTTNDEIDTVTVTVDWNDVTDRDRTSINFTSNDGSFQSIPVVAIERGAYGMVQNLGQVDGSFVGGGASPGLGEGAMTERMGDVNGDGYMDVLVSALRSTPSTDGYGRRTYLYLGGPDKLAMDKSVQGDADVTIHSNYHPNMYQFDGAWGYSNCVADIDGDGYDDIIVGDITAGYFRRWYHKPVGAISIFFGGADFADQPVKFTDTDRDTRVVAHGDSTAWRDFGTSISAGDLNGDGKHDLIVGSDNSAYRTWVTMGRSQEAWKTTNWSYGSSPEVVVYYMPDSYLLSGARCVSSSTGDLDNDGYDDMIVAGHTDGLARIWYGRATGWSASLATDATIDDMPTVNYGYTAYSQHQVSMKGDVNGDGYDDLLVSTSDADHYKKVYLYFGGATRLSGALDLDADADVTFTVGNYAEARGHNVYIVQDMNGDDIDEVVIAAWEYDAANASSGRSAGKARTVLFMGRSSWNASYSYVNTGGSESTNDADASFIAEYDGDTTFRYPITSGDFDNDGLGDLFLLHEDNDEGGSNRGQVYAILGQKLVLGRDQLIFRDPSQLSDTVTLKNVSLDAQSLNWTAATGNSWITSISASSGSLASNASATVTITISHSGLSDGIHDGLVTFSTGSHDKILPVRLIKGDNAIAEPPVLGLSEEHVVIGSSETTGTFDISNTGGGSLEWTLEPAAADGWLSVSPTSGTTTTTATTVTATVTHNSEGFDQHKRITISHAESGDQYVYVTMKANGTPGSQGNKTLTEPHLYSVDSLDEEVNLFWRDTGLSATGFNIKYGTTTGTYTSTETVGAVTSYNLENLTNNTAYYFVVSANTGSGETGNSNEESATPIELGAYSAPTLSTAVKGNTGVSLTWTEVENADGFKVKYGTATGTYTSTDDVAVVTGHTVTGLTNDTTYYFVVSAYTGVSESANSNELNATPDGSDSVPLTPNIISATPSDQQIDVTWGNVSGTDSYTLKYGTTSGTYTTTTNVGTALTYSATGLTNGTNYYFVVNATNTHGTSSDSAEVVSQPGDAIVTWIDFVNTSLAGTVLSRTGSSAWDADAVSMETYDGDIGVEFVANETNTYRMVGLADTNPDSSYTSIDYAIYARNNGTVYVYESGTSRGQKSTYVSGDKLSVERTGTTITYKKNGTTIYTSTLSSDEILMVDCSLNSSSATVKDAKFLGTARGLPQAVTDLGVARFDDGQVLLKWTEHANNGKSISSYEVQFGTVADGTFASSVIDDVTPGCLVTGLTNDTEYEFRVIARNEIGSSSVSNVIESTPMVPTDVDWTSLVKTETRFTLVSSGLTPTSSYPAFYNAAILTDGSTATSPYVGAGTGAQWIQMDLGQTYNLNEVKVWHYWSDARTYHDVIVQLSTVADFSSNVTTVFNNDTNNSAGQGTGTDSEYAESSAGKSIAFASTSARYVRMWSNGSTANTSNHYVEVEIYCADGENNLVKTTGSSWDADAISDVQFDTDLMLEFTAAMKNKAIMCGLSDDNTSSSYTTIDYAVYLTSSGTYNVYENGTNRGQKSTYGVGDRIAIERVGSTITYLKNDVVVYTSTISSSGRLQADCSISSVGGVIKDARFFKVDSLVPGAPFDFAVTEFGDGYASFSWDWPANNGGIIQGYDIQYGTVASGLYDSTLTDIHPFVPLAATVTGLTNDTAYQFRVVAQNVNGESEPSGVKNSTPMLPYDVTWVEATAEIAVSGNSIMRTGGSGWNDGAVSRSQYDGNMMLEFKAAATNKALMCGLSDNNDDENYTTIDYAVYLTSSGTYNVYENGTNRGQKSTYVVGDRIAIERVGTTITYLKNDVVVYTSTIASSGNLMVDSSISTNGGEISEARLFKVTPAVPGDCANFVVTGADEKVDLFWDYAANNGSVLTSYEIEYGTVSSGQYNSTHVDDTTVNATITGLTNGTDYQFRVLAKNALGSGSVSASQTKTPDEAWVVWTDLVYDTSTYDNILTNTYYTGWGYGGAASTRSFSSDVRMDVTVSETNTTRMIGLSDTNTNAHYNTIDYAIYLYNAAIRVYENGTMRTSGNLGSYVTGDTLSVKRVGETVTYLKNGTVFYTSNVLSTGSLLVDCSINSKNGTLKDVKVYSLLPEDPTGVDAAPRDTEVDVTWDLNLDPSGYEIQYGTATGTYTSTVTLGNVASHRVTGLTNDTTYYFVVVATNGNGSSDASTEVSETPDEIVAGVAKIGSTTYNTLQAAYNAAANNDTILCDSGTFVEDLTCNRDISVTFEGGYNSSFSTRTGTSILEGSLTTSSGTVELDRIEIRL